MRERDGITDSMDSMGLSKLWGMVKDMVMDCVLQSMRSQGRA